MYKEALKFHLHITKRIIFKQNNLKIIFRIFLCFLLYSNNICFAQNGVGPSEPIHLLINKPWKADRSTYFGNRHQNDSLYTFMKILEIPTHQIYVVYKNTIYDKFNWGQIRDPNVKIFIRFKPNKEIVFVYDRANSNNNRIIFNEFSTQIVPDNLLYKIILTK